MGSLALGGIPSRLGTISKIKSREEWGAHIFIFFEVKRDCFRSGPKSGQIVDFNRAVKSERKVTTVKPADIFFAKK